MVIAKFSWKNYYDSKHSSQIIILNKVLELRVKRLKQNNC